mmetsp:Transcript_2909/g.4029  ORF Transcript_2909/g.4029 Transcript_2909/m.4029 type:complete len:195 (+) Transcript_2909:132-716(+)|eukprot:CAMPEP_0116059012 /NCGR_PEP_ID=MMETSP0322-20121206/5546_1 /TAXON_ID=163516 /ORGANISM="Leptocylindrus danicus var. apora, Strain B651" /LENGTH=194 /DNA_ID=CAMNT_0003543319 /DNA_START=96 /DNA_END=680 /DNA_ORIENTATION=+
MEVASPFAVSASSNKRSLLSRSPEDDMMLDSVRSGKRQRCSTSGFASPSTATPSHLRKGSFFGNSNGFGETQNNWYQKQQNIIADMKRVIEQQTSEIEKLKNENVQYQKTLLQTNASHEKVVGENKILKKAVTIQQERQNMAAKEVDNLRRENENANERIRRLEQMNSQLRFLVESSNMNRGFGFMDTRPPDVY